ncbi:MAG: PhzF family phenazine biosynthesis isomerase [Jatrophihabitans sp.]
MRAFVIDAFADAAFRGNPAGVVLLDAPADPGWMQQVAAEFKHAETAFVSPRADGDRDLRWFTPAVEVDLCGHATLAATRALQVTGADGPFAFHTRSGTLRTRLEGECVVLDFPVLTVTPHVDVRGLADALGARIVAAFRTGGDDLLIELSDEAVVAGLRPDIAALGGIDCRGVIVTAAAQAGTDYDFVSRFFGPRVGVAEDPVTGSAHCALAPFWAARLHRSMLVGAQLSARGGRVSVSLDGDRVELRGRAIVVLDGDLLI